MEIRWVESYEVVVRHQFQWWKQWRNNSKNDWVIDWKTWRDVGERSGLFDVCVELRQPSVCFQFFTLLLIISKEMEWTYHTHRNEWVLPQLKGSWKEMSFLVILVSSKSIIRMGMQSQFYSIPNSSLSD